MITDIVDFVVDNYTFVIIGIIMLIIIIYFSTRTPSSEKFTEMIGYDKEVSDLILDIYNGQEFTS